MRPRALIALAGCLAACDGPGAPRPNVVLVVVDTLRADHVRSLGYGRETTPRLDALAERSVVFERAYAHAPWTKSSVASLLCSVDPKDHGIEQWNQRLDDELVTLTEVLARSGYDARAVVSHHAFHPAFNDFHRGFESFDISPFEQQGDPHRISSAEQVTDRALVALAQSSEPFFLWVHYFDPHNAYLPHAGHEFGKRPIDRYDAEIAFTDRHLGRLLDALDQRDRRAGPAAPGTVLVFTADHGEEFEDHGGRFHTVTLYDELLRVPLLIRAPGLEPGRIERTVGLMDVAPTILALAGLEPEPAFGGRTIPVVDGSLALAGDRRVFAETRLDADKRCVIEGRFKLVQDRSRTDGWELYDLEADPGERTDVLELHPETVQRLRDALRRRERSGRRMAGEQALSEEMQRNLEALGYAR